MKYEYMKEYPCNGVKPDLPDDVLVRCCGKYSRLWHNDTKAVHKWPWSNFYKFVIADERYKPAAEYSGTPWFERGELPPVGERVRTNIGDADVVATSPDGSVCVLLHEHLHVYHLASISPIRTERDELVDSVAEAIHRGSAKNRTYKDIAIALYDAGMLKKPD